MTLIFWQNIVSPHQLPYIKALSNLDENVQVILLVPKLMDEHREKMGWHTEKIETSNGFKIIVEPSSSEMKSIFKDLPNAQHFFSGLRATSMVFNAFKLSLRYNVKRHLIVEGPFLYKTPKILHYIKTLLRDYRYFNKISKVFAIGHHALNWYPKFNFKKNQIVPFSYVVNTPEKTGGLQLEGRIKFLFVGGLSHRKAVDTLLMALENLNGNYSLDIIGDGPEIESLQKLVLRLNLKSKVNFLGTIDNSEILKMYQNYDVHILPSRHDGWGAVVNEALMAGLFVICSEQCGAKELIKDKFNGIVFSHKKKQNLFKALSYCITNKDEIRHKKETIKKWSRCIEPEVVAKYFLKTLNTDYHITPPWQKN